MNGPAVAALDGRRIAAGPKFSGANEHFPGDDLFDPGPLTRSEERQNVAAATLNATANAAAIYGIIHALRSGETKPWQAPVAALAGTYTADLVSGLLHWAFDTWFTADITPVRRIVLIVREHHVYPQRIFKYGLAEDVGLMSAFGLASSAPTAVLLACDRPQTPHRRLAVCVFSLTYSVLVTVSLDLHKAGHSFNPGPLTRAGQRAGILLTPQHHMKHHAGEHDSHYCLVNGWADRTLGELGLFKALEAFVQHTTRAIAREDDRRWRRLFGRWVRG